jgi:hypothetical protein
MFLNLVATESVLSMYNHTCVDNLKEVLNFNLSLIYFLAGQIHVQHNHIMQSILDLLGPVDQL